MKNLENAYVSELSKEEMQSINGGFPWLVAGLILAGLLYSQKDY